MKNSFLRVLDQYDHEYSIVFLGRDCGALASPILSNLRVKSVLSLQVNREILLLLDIVFSSRLEAFDDLYRSLSGTPVRDWLSTFQFPLDEASLAFFESKGALGNVDLLQELLRPTVNSIARDLNLVGKYVLVDIGWYGTMHRCLLSLASTFAFPKPFSAVYFSAPEYSENVSTCISWPKHRYSIFFFLLRFKASVLETVIADPRPMRNVLFQFSNEEKLDLDQKRIAVFEYLINKQQSQWKNFPSSFSNLLFWSFLLLSKQESGHKSNIG